MKAVSFAAGLLLLSLLPISAQVNVEVFLDQEHYLAGEAISARVQIKNQSGQTLKMGADPDWLTFSIESRDGFIVVNNGDVPVQGEFDLETSQVATTKPLNLEPYFTIPGQGRYNVTATVRIKEWDGQITSPSKAFDIIRAARLWAQEFGVPVPEGATNREPEVRQYVLEQANYLRTQLRLYMRLTDHTGTQVLKVVPIGRMVSFGRPEHQIDKHSRLHVLYQNGARTFAYSVFDYDGELVLRQTFNYVNSRPRLTFDGQGNVGVMGGVRQANAGDFPSQKTENNVNQKNL